MYLIIFPHKLVQYLTKNRHFLATKLINYLLLNNFLYAIGRGLVAGSLRRVGSSLRAHFFEESTARIARLAAHALALAAIAARSARVTLRTQGGANALDTTQKGSEQNFVRAFSAPNRGLS